MNQADKKTHADYDYASKLSKTTEDENIYGAQNETFTVHL